MTDTTLMNQGDLVDANNNSFAAAFELEYDSSDDDDDLVTFGDLRCRAKTLL